MALVPCHSVHQTECHAVDRAFVVRATSMHRWTALLLGILVVAALLVMLIGARAKRPVALPPEFDSAVERQTSPAVDAGDTPLEETRPDGQSLDILPDGGSIPPLPAGVPQSVSMGVIQFAYRGAELAPANAPSRTEAYERATRVLEVAKTDFAAAVRQGDPASAMDLGEVPRGVLEPLPEYVLFTLKPNSTYDMVLDTPRGFWIVRRNR